MALYEVVREIQNECANNQMRDVFFQEARIGNLEEYVRARHKDKDVELTREDLEEMWESMQAVLPKDAFRDFRSYVPFTDGEGETVAYVLPADKTASVFEGAVTKVEMHNELRDTPKTGDDSNPALWFALLGVSAAGAAVLGIVGFRKRRKEGAE